MSSQAWLISVVLLTLCPVEQGFYVPGVAPVEFKKGEPIEVRVRIAVFLQQNTNQAIKLTSTKTVVPYEYYTVPFCKPEGEIQYKSENLGEVMRGDRIVNTPIHVGFIFLLILQDCSDFHEEQHWMQFVVLRLSQDQ